MFGLVAGVLFGFLVMEAALRPIATPGTAKGLNRPYTVRQYEEGIATANFAADQRRLTGQSQLPGANNILLLGDSYVYAGNVEDDETMGGRLENKLRTGGKPVNVVQYGWAGASVPEYVAVAERLLRQWNPGRVVIVLNRADLGTDPISVSDTSEYRMVVDDQGKWTMVHEPKRRNALGLGGLRSKLTDHSAVFNMLYGRYIRLSRSKLIDWPWERKETKPAVERDPRLAAVPRASVQALKQAFGSRLLIAFDTDSRGAEHQPDPGREALFQQACRDEGVECVCLAQPIRQGEERLQRYAHGFHNTAPRIGHYNTTGHALVADTLYDALLASGLGGQ